MWDSDFLQIDGVTYNIPVQTDITRSFDVLDKYANRTADGDLKRKVIGTYKNYQMNFYKQEDNNFDDYEDLVDVLASPTAFHTFTIGDYTFTGYVSSVSDTLYLYKDGKSYHRGLTAKFTAKKPWRTP